MKHILIILTIALITLCYNSYSQEKGDLRIEVEGIRNASGHVSIALFSSENGFPEKSENAFKLQVQEIKNGQAVFNFQFLPPGNYAFAVLHDENKDGEMKKNILGIPREGFAFSQNFKPKIGAPDFEEASFKLNSGTNKVIVRMIYYL